MEAPCGSTRHVFDDGDARGERSTARGDSKPSSDRRGACIHTSGEGGTSYSGTAKEMQSGHASACRRGHSHVPSSLLLATRPSEPANAMRTGERETGSSGEARGDVRMPALAALRVALSGGRHLVQRLPGEIADRSQLQLRSAPLSRPVAYVRNGELIRDDRRARPRTRRPKIEFRYAYRIRHAYPGIVHMILRRSLYKLVQCLRRSSPFRHTRSPAQRRTRRREGATQITQMADDTPHHISHGSLGSAAIRGYCHCARGVVAHGEPMRRHRHQLRRSWDLIDRREAHRP